ncbi:hypothetical protein AWM75_00400 [Aerococcus urinaehominis]|uniref:Uncharacterized protein n=1 Tax=Aerococcus urinaehominis TaxID=128944 RepID=A0A120IAM3_9LACT|nr:magnesium transporter CorA family protein [Aerococcus urinaehominis]AMB98543.1 hypothetical protein AWM75_00400 [Aerococcus urinaehominis]SDL78721.1 magnesium transporter [Aerococcus urinaehominis]
MQHIYQLKDKDHPTWEKLIWRYVYNPSAEEVEKLIADYDIPRDFVSSALDPYEVSRQEAYRNSQGDEFELLVFLYPDYHQSQEFKDRLQVHPLSVIIHDHEVITISKHPLSFLDDIAHDFADSDLVDYSTFGLVLAIFWQISKRYTQYLVSIDQRIHQIEEMVTDSTSNEILYELIGLNKGLVYYETAIDGNHNILESLVTFLKEEEAPAKDLRLLRDVQVEHNQAEIMVYQQQKND